jgi:hypothetical protein
MPSIEPTDPIHAAIEAAREAGYALDAYSKRFDRSKPKGWQERESALIAEQRRTEQAVLATPPVTPGGRQALVDFLDEVIDQHGYADGRLPDDDHEIWALAYRAAAAALRASATVSPADRLITEILDLWPVWTAHLDPNADGETSAAFEQLQERRHALLDAADELPATLENIAPKALALAWIEHVEQERTGYGRSFYATNGRLAFDINEAASAGPVKVLAPVPAAPPTLRLVDLVDFASASLEDLQAIHDTADEVGGLAHALVWTGRCKARGRGDQPNLAGELMQWLGDALTDVETAANAAARRRIPKDRLDRETRLKMLALPVIKNGDPDEAEAFAHELLAYAKAEREGR